MIAQDFKNTATFKIGYAFVVGDLFHIGHLRHLKSCRSRCDYLIVGVYTSELAESYKRKPIIPVNERMDIVEALNCVDEVRKVRLKDGRDPTPVLKRLAADGYNVRILFGSKDHTSDDWKKIYARAEKYMKSVGGRVQRLPYYHKRTTTLLRESIFKSQLPYMDVYMKNLKKKAS